MRIFHARDKWPGGNCPGMSNMMILYKSANAFPCNSQGNPGINKSKTNVSSFDVSFLNSFKNMLGISKNVSRYHNTEISQSFKIRHEKVKQFY